MGTWIETYTPPPASPRSALVVPLVGTWIETSDQFRSDIPGIVVPLVGTWIETLVEECRHNSYSVVPLVGTWIETFCCPVLIFCVSPSFPSWERGLKHFFDRELVCDKRVVPLVGTWIETNTAKELCEKEGGRSPRGNVD